jgi:hypothetical protein
MFIVPEHMASFTVPESDCHPQHKEKEGAPQYTTAPLHGLPPQRRVRYTASERRLSTRPATLLP